ncbi:MAG: hypothetical protein H0X64_13410 [Gemmatimonadaceae bacterium]|nr:hypothetical protein [Gemmatimonadaceae bacterium]
MGTSFRREPRRSNTRRTFFGATQAAWMGARARNALRRPVFIAAVSIAVFAIALIALIAVPRESRREARLAAEGLDIPVDTMTYLETALAAQLRLAQADAALGAVRAEIAAQRQVVPDPTVAQGSAQRDALAERIVALGALVDRAENAPLPISYRALAQSPDLSGDARVLALLDTLSEVEREREAFGAVGGVDPIFVALTTRVNDIGRAIQGIAEQRRQALSTELAALVPVTPVGTVVAEIDTVGVIRDRQIAQSAYATAQEAFGRARVNAIDMDRRRRVIEAEEGGGAASPLTLLAAAFVLAAVLGFASALFDELRRPRLADAAEAERVTGIRVLGVIRPQAAIGDRTRRATDRALAGYVDPYNDGHQLAYLHLATASPGMLVTTVTGDESAVTAVVAVNLAAVSAEEARGTIIIDTDAATSDVAAALEVSAKPGLVDLMDDTVNWADATHVVQVGRDSTVDVIPSGTAAPLPGADEVSAYLREISPRLAREYDTVIVVASEAHVVGGIPSTLPSPLVVYCARIGHTRINTLRRALESIRESGGEPVGLVVWDDVIPSLEAPAELATRSRRTPKTSEHEVAMR